MPRSEPTQAPVPSAQPAPGPAVSTTGILALTVAALYFGRDIFIPLALAVLLSFILAPALIRLRRLGVPRVAAVIVVVLVALSAVAGVAVAVGAQLVQLAENLPTYQRNISDKIKSLRESAPGGGIVEKVTGTVRSLGRELSKQDPATPAADGRESVAAPHREPVPVVIEPAPAQPLEVIQNVLSPLLGPLGTAGLVVLFIVFILIEREELRDRFLKLVGGGDLQRTTEAITEAAERVSRYLVMQLIVNVTYGIPIGIGLWLIGVPNAVLWGVLATVLRFIPYIGPWLAAVFPLTIAFGLDPGWSMLAWTVALFLATELVSNNAVEPWLYGSSTGLSSFAIILAAIFWTLLWGPVGLFLATPLTVCLVVIGRYVPSFEFLGVLLGSDPVLTPAERLYQRLLAGNLEEATEIAHQHVDAASAVSFFDEVAIPALRLADGDRQRSADAHFRREIADGMITVLREVQDYTAPGPAPAAGKQAPDRAAPPEQEPARVLCIAGRTELDLAAAEIVAARLEELGISAATMAPMAVSRGAIGQIDLHGIDAVCIGYFHHAPDVYARFVARRLLRRAPRLAIVVCRWNGADTSAAAPAGSVQDTTLPMVSSVEAAARHVVAALNARNASPAASAVSEAEREAVGRLQHRGIEPGANPAIDRLIAELSDTMGTPVVMLAPVEETGSAEAGTSEGGSVEAGTSERGSAVTSATPGSGPARSEAGTSGNASSSLALSRMLCAAVVTAGNTIAVDDVAKDERFEANAILVEKGVRSLLIAPLRRTSGRTIGALCVLGSREAHIGQPEVHAIEAAAADVVASMATARDVALPRAREARVGQ
jgi:predicted PurR-regulated permease PerM